MADQMEDPNETAAWERLKRDRALHTDPAGSDPKVTITTYRSTIRDALTALTMIAADPGAAERYRHQSAAAAAELGEALREAEQPGGDRG